VSNEVSGVVILSCNVLVLGKIREQFLLSLSRDDDDDDDDDDIIPHFLFAG